MSEPLISIDDAAAYLSYNPVTIRRYARLGRLPAIRMPGGNWRFRRSDLDKFIDSCVVRNKQPDDSITEQSA